MDVIIGAFQAVGFVAYPLLIFSVIAVALILERWQFWWKVTHRQEKVVRECLGLYRRNPRAALFKLEQNADLPISRIFIAGLELDDASPEDFRLALETALAAELPLLKRYTTVFDTIITLAPFLGLLGTVTGIIQILSSIQLGNIGGTDTQGVGAGIAEALYSTAFGLIVAIPTQLISNVFRSLYLRQLSKIQEYGGQLELLHRQRLEQHLPSLEAYANQSNWQPPRLDQSEPYTNSGRSRLEQHGSAPQESYGSNPGWQRPDPSAQDPYSNPGRQRPDPSAQEPYGNNPSWPRPDSSLQEPYTNPGR